MAGKKRNTRKAHKKQASELEQELQAWDLRSRGFSLREISKSMNLSGPQRAKDLLERGFKEFYSPQVAQRRAESDARLQSMLAELMPLALPSGKKRQPLEKRLAIVDRVIKIDRELRVLHGLDAPEQSVQLTAELPTKDVRQELLDRLARLAESAAAGSDPPGSQ